MALSVRVLSDLMGRPYGLSFKFDLARRKIFGNRMGFLEVPRLARQLHFFFAVRGAVVRHRETQARRSADGVLVVEFDGITPAAYLCFSSTRLGGYFRIRVYLGSLHSEPYHRQPAQAIPRSLRTLS